jgi:glycosyltransferase involved in cell wall biosynthesis
MAAKHTTPFFSIVMPVYGVEAYITDAINDILNQDFEDWELIIVDDCSQDASIPVAESLLGDDPRTRIVRHDENRGLSAARNTGMRHASGRYLWIPDPDDRYDTDLLRMAFESLTACPTDLLLFGHSYDYYDESGALVRQDRLALAPSPCMQQNELRERTLALEQETHLGYVWNKMYRRDRVTAEGLLFQDDAPLIEDILFNVEYLRDASSMTVLAATPYHYASRRKANLTHAFVPNYFELHKTRIRSLKELLEYWNLLDDKARSVLGALFGRYILSALERNCDTRMGMSHQNRSAWCTTLFGDPLFIELIPYARATSSKSLSLCLSALRRKSTLLCTALGRLIYIVQRGFLSVFVRVKAGR